MKDNNIDFSWTRYCANIIFIFTVTILLFCTFGNDTSAGTSLFYESLVFFLLTIFSSSLLFHNSRITIIFVVAYIVKLSLGIIHYLWFIDPDYFSRLGTTCMMHHEFQAVTDFVSSAADEKSANGIFYIKTDGWVTHQELLSILAIPFHFFGTKMMNIGPINSFFSLFAAMNVYIAYAKYTEWSKEKVLFILYMLAYFPATLITTYFYRDIVGWAFMSIGLVMIVLSKSNISRFISVICAIFLFYLQRNIYVAIPPLILVAQLLLNKRKSSPTTYVFAVAALIVLPALISVFSEDTTISSLEEVSKWPIYMLPIKIFVGLVGPFPWTNFFFWKMHLFVSYYLSDYIMGCLNVGCLLCFLRNIQKYTTTSSLTESAIAGLLLLIMGIMNTAMNMTYISIAIFFMLPWLLSPIDNRVFKRYQILSFIGLLLLNIASIMIGFGGIGAVVK